MAYTLRNALQNVMQQIISRNKGFSSLKFSPNDKANVIAYCLENRFASPDM